MGSAKELIVKVIPSKVAVPFVKTHHYSGKVVNNSNLHFGVFYEGRLHGVMSFGPSLDKSKIQGLVEGTGWNEFIELNRMAFDDVLPRNSESRAIAIAMKLIRKNAPQIKWVISFADGCQCGDGTIYRASGFILTGYSSGSMWKLPDYLVKINGGDVAHRMKVQDKRSALSRYILQETHGKNLTMEKYVEKFGGEILDGKMFRYIYFIDSTYRDRLLVPIIPFSKIDEMGAGMYKGKKVTQAERHNKKQPE